MRKYRHIRMTREDEMRAVADFRSKTRLLLNLGNSFVDTLAAMQHYGIPTRMLDFTHSFFVALYFAFNDVESKRRFRNHAIWAIRLSKTFFVSKVMNDEIYRGLVQAIGDKGVKDGVDDIFFDFLQEMAQEDAVSRSDKHRELVERILTGKDFTRRVGILPVNISGSNARMLAQNGLFIMTADFSSFEDSLKLAFGLTDIKNMSPVRIDRLRSNLNASDELVLVKFILSEDLRKDVDCLLRAANIATETLFPDLSGIASRIR